MPVYEYECEDCSLRFEKMQRFSEDPVRLCPDCGGPVHRVIQPVGAFASALTAEDRSIA